MDLKKYAVVFFPIDNSIEVVPSNWLSADQKKCPFPVILPKGFKATQKDFNSTPDRNWPLWDSEVKRTFGNLIAFRQLSPINCKVCVNDNHSF